SRFGGVVQFLENIFIGLFLVFTEHPAQATSKWFGCWEISPAVVLVDGITIDKIIHTVGNRIAIYAQPVGSEHPDQLGSVYRSCWQIRNVNTCFNVVVKNVESEILRVQVISAQGVNVFH